MVDFAARSGRPTRFVRGNKSRIRIQTFLLVVVDFTPCSGSNGPLLYLSDRRKTYAGPDSTGR